MNRLLNVKQASSYLQVHPCTVYKLVEKEEIPFIRKKGTGIRIKKEDLDNWLEQGRRKNIISPGNFQDRFTFSAGINISRWGGKCALAKSKSKSRINFSYGAIYTRKTKSGNIRWAIDYYDARGKRVQQVVKNAQTREDAVTALQYAVKSELCKAHGVTEEKKPICFEELAELYMRDYCKVNKKSWKTDLSYLKGMNALFKGRLIDSLSSQDIEQYKAKRIEDGVALTTINKCLQILSKMFNLAISWGYLKENPARGVKKFPEEPFRRKRILSREEQEKLFETMVPGYLRSMVKIFLNTGLRRKELFQLCWEHVDLRRKQIFIKETKTSKSRYIPMNETVFKELERLFQTSCGQGVVFVNPKTGKAFVDVRRAFYGARRRAGIKDLLLLDLRRTFATRLLEAGVDIVTVQHLLGHTSVTTTQIYTMTNQEEKRRAVAALEAQKRPHLLPICDLDEKTEKGISPNHWFSIN